MSEKKYPYQNFLLEDMEGEIWKEIKGFEGYLLVSNQGRVKALARTIYRKRNGIVHIPEKIVKQQVLESKAGAIRKTVYKQLFISYQIDYKIHQIRVTRAVYSTFITSLDKLKEKHFVSHLDDDNLNNRIENLFINTASELGKRNIATGKSRIPDSTKYPEKIREKMRASLYRPVDQYSLDQRFLASYKSMRAASEKTGVIESSISASARGVYKSAGGFIWKYASKKY